MSTVDAATRVIAGPAEAYTMAGTVSCMLRGARSVASLTRIWASAYTRREWALTACSPAADYHYPRSSGAGADGGTIDARGAQTPRICVSNGRPRWPQLHRCTPAGVVGTSIQITDTIQTTDTSGPDHSCRRQMRAIRGTGSSDGRATVLSSSPNSSRKGVQMILKEPQARAA